MTEAGLASGLHGDEVKYAFTKALRRATRPTWGSLFEPRRKQNLYANPKRTAKSQSSLTQTQLAEKSSNNFQRFFRPPTPLSIAY
jgi:hypothetical protein